MPSGRNGCWDVRTQGEDWGIGSVALTVSSLGGGGSGCAHGSQAQRISGIACLLRTGEEVWLPKAAELSLDMPSTKLG